MPNKTYIIGHKNPDLDSVAAAISLSVLRNKLNKDNENEFVPVIAGNINLETKYILEKFNFEIPEILEDAADQKIILVDHNEENQSIARNENTKILEIIDHHKLNFAYSEPIPVLIQAWGSSCSIIAQEFFRNSIEINKNLAGLMLAAILVDTVITKSPTCTEADIEIIKKLAFITDIKDWQEFGMEIFKVRSSVAQLSNTQIIKSDFKDFEASYGKVGIGQVETVDLDEFQSRVNELINELQNLQTSEDYHTVILFITDIMDEGSLFLVASQDVSVFEKAFQTQLENNQVYLKNIISRKKQVAPLLT